MKETQSATGSGVEGYAAREQTRKVNVGRTERKASLIGGAALALSGVKKLKQKQVLPGLAMMVAGGMFMYRGQTGHCSMYEALGKSTAGAEDTGIQVEKLLTINRTPQEVYNFWRNLENLPKFMQHIESVRVTGTRSHWRARGPGDMTIEWEAEMVEDVPGRRISWRSSENADIPNEGTVEFREAPGARGTELSVHLKYYPPGGTAGKLAAKVAHQLNVQQIEEDLKRLKQILETGETATARFAERRPYQPRP